MFYKREARQVIRELQQHGFQDRVYRTACLSNIQGRRDTYLVLVDADGDGMMDQTIATHREKRLFAADAKLPQCCYECRFLRGNRKVATA